MFIKDRVVFASNLCEISFHSKFSLSQKRESYLLSEKYSTEKNKELALKANDLSRLIISDNGNFTRMSKIAQKFKDDSHKLLLEAKEAVRVNEQISEELKQKRLALINKISVEAEKVIPNDGKHREILAKQLSIKPDYLIGFEDLTIPALILSGLMDEVFFPKHDEVSHFQNKTQKLYERQLNGDYGYAEELKKLSIYYVVHAYDYNSAYNVGQMMRNSQIEHFAISYGGPMKSNRWRTHIKWENELIDLGGNFPEKYLLSQSITSGFLDGLGRKVHLHILGCGSPIMILLTGSLLPFLHSLTFDSSAPLKDSFDGNVYSRNLALTKIRIEKLVAYQLSKGKPYYSPNIFYQEYLSNVKHDWNALYKALEIEESDDLKNIYKKVLNRPEYIREFIPFFSKITSNEEAFFEPIRVFRSGMNNWILRNICNNLRNRVSSLEQFYQWIDKEINRYEANSNSKWGKSVSLTYDMTRKKTIPQAP